MQGFAAPNVRRLQRGLTLIEVCVAAAVAAVLAGSAAPAFEAMNKRKAVDRLSAEIVSGIHFARSEAVARHVGVRLSFVPSTDGGTCVVVHTGSAHDCTCSATGTVQCVASAVPIKSTFVAAGSAVSVSANVGSMRFDQNNGTVSPAGTIRVTTSDGRAINHVVNIMARVRTCASGGSIPGVNPC